MCFMVKDFLMKGELSGLYDDLDKAIKKRSESVGK